MKTIDLFHDTDYRRYLRDWLDAARQRRGLSRRGFSLRAGLKSSGHLKMILDGKRNLGLKSLERFMNALRLTGEERLYFHNLVLWNQASTEAQKGLYEGKFVLLRKCRRLQPEVRQRIERLRKEILDLLATDLTPAEASVLAEQLLASD